MSLAEIVEVHLETALLTIQLPFFGPQLQFTPTQRSYAYATALTQHRLYVDRPGTF